MYDLNDHHQEWLGSTTTNHHGVTAFVFASVPGCDQLVFGPTHARGGILDLMMTNVSDLVRVAVVSPIGNSDHSSLSAVISKAQAISNLCVSRKVFLKHQVHWSKICVVQYGICPGVTSDDNPVEVLNELLMLLVRRFIPTKVIHVRNKDSLGLMINAFMISASSRRIIFREPVISLLLTGNSLSAVK